MTNPYTPPDADLESARTKRKRPGWVWAICLLYGFSAISSMILTPLMMSGAIPVPPEQTEALSRFGPARWAFSIFAALLLMAFVVQLFRLRASAFLLCATVFAISIGSTVVSALLGTLPASRMSTVGIASQAFSLGLLLAVLLYTHHLRKKGVLT